MFAAIDPEAVLGNAGRVLVLFVPMALGWLLARRAVLPTSGGVIDGLNGFVLLVCFPALIALGVLRVDTASISGWGFWVSVPVVAIVAVAVSALGARLTRSRSGGTTALVLLFGNTAFLGIPYAVAVFGEAARGPASIAVAVQVSIAVAVGPALLQRWSGTGAGTVDWGRLLRQPLLWAPLVGLVTRLFPASVERGAADVLEPLGGAAAPTAMFVLGLYLARPNEADAVSGVAVRVATLSRLIVMPAVSLGLAWVLVELGALTPLAASVIVLLGATPAAVSTFSLAQNEGVGAETVASIVLWSSVISMATLPLWATVVESIW